VRDETESIMSKREWIRNDDRMTRPYTNTQTQTFTYDSLDRLSSAVASGGTGGTYGSQSYTYNSTTGNLASKAGVSYTYGDDPLPYPPRTVGYQTSPIPKKTIRDRGGEKIGDGDGWQHVWV